MVNTRTIEGEVAEVGVPYSDAEVAGDFFR